MIIKPEKVNNVRNRLLEHIGISLVAFVGGYLAVLFSGARSRDANGFLTYLLENEWAYVSICCAIVVVTNIVLFIRRVNKKNVCGVEFRDEDRKLVVYLMSFYSNKFATISIPYTEYSIEISKKVSETHDKYLHLNIRQNNTLIGSINGNDTYWTGQKKVIDKIIRKSSEVKGNV